MRKLFTLTAAIISAMAMNAAAGSWQFSGGDAAPAVNSSETGTNMKVEFLTSDAAKSFGKESAKYNAAVPADLKSKGSNGIKLGGNALYLKAYLTDGTSFKKGDTLHVCGYNTWKISSSDAHSGDVVTSLATGSRKNDYNVGKVVLAKDVDTLYLMRAEGKGTCIAAIKYAVFVDPGVPVLSTDKEELDLQIGRTGAASKEASFTLSGIHLDGLTTNIEFPTHDGLTIDQNTLDVAVDGTLSQTFKVTYAPTVAEEEFNGKITITAGTLSVEIALNCNVKAKLVQASISESTTWDFSKVSVLKEIRLTDATTPKKNDTTLLANVDDVVNDENFNSQALLFAGEYIVRDGTYCQGTDLIFNTTVAGTLKIKYSNTGSNGTRYVLVNGAKIDGDPGSANTTAHEASVAVEAGEVRIAAGVKADSTREMLRFSVITFTKDDGGATAIDNTNAEVKAIKVIENGQFFIIKNGIKYNANGAIVK